MIYTPQDLTPLADQTFGCLKVRETDHVLHLTLNRPHKKNAMNPVLMAELAWALAYARYTESVWAVVLRAEGDVFCAGADLNAFAGDDQAAASTIRLPAQDILIGEELNGVHKPVIARVQGSVYAGGFLLICGCHYVVAADGIQLSLPEARRGLWPLQVMESLRQHIPMRPLLDLCLRCEPITAQRGLELGLLTHVVPAAELDSTIEALLQTIRLAAPAAVRIGFEAWDQLRTVERGTEHAFLRSRLNELIATQDFREGLAAFKEKRPPAWSGK
jgi:enoyl-CoA hydratase/carnithine racemase